MYILYIVLLLYIHVIIVCAHYATVLVARIDHPSDQYMSRHVKLPSCCIHVRIAPSCGHLEHKSLCYIVI